MATKDVFVDPAKTTLAELLDLASDTPSGIITIRGERSDSTVEWGVALIIGPVANDAISVIDTWAEAVAIDSDEVLPDFPLSKPIIVNEPN